MDGTDREGVYSLFVNSGSTWRAKASLQSKVDWVAGEIAGSELHHVH